MALTLVTPTTGVTAGLRMGGAYGPVNIKATSDANAAATITLGFNPSKVHVVNITDRIQHLWLDTMAAGQALKVIADGTATDATNGVTVANGVLTLGTDILLASKTYHIRCEP